MAAGPKKKFGIWKILAAVVLLLLVAVVTAPFLIDVDQFRPQLQSKLTAALGNDVRVGRLKFSLASGSVTADEIVIADDPKFGAVPLVKAGRLQVEAELKPLIFSKTLRITAITLDQPEINLVRTTSGKWNFSGLAGRPLAPRAEETGKGPSVSDISIGSLKVTGGRITMIHAGARGKPHVYEQVSITAKNLSFTSVFPFVMTATLPGGGTLSLKGKAGPVHETDAILTPFEATIAIQRFNLVASGLVEPQSGLGALIDFDGNVDSDGSRLHTQGHANVDKLQLVKGGSPALRPVALTYSLGYDLKSQAGSIESATAVCEKAITQLEGSYDLRGDPMTVNLKLRGDRMPVQDLERLLPAVGVGLPKGASLLGGTLSINIATQGPIDKTVTSGTLNLAGTRLKGYDLGTTLSKVVTLAGIRPTPETDIEKLASMIRITPEGYLVKDLILVVPSLGELTGGGVIRPDQSMDFKMTARLKKAEGLAGGLVRIAGSDGLGIPFVIRGTMKEPRFSPDVMGAAGSILDSAKGVGSNTAGNAVDALKDLLGKKKR